MGGDDALWARFSSATPQAAGSCAVLIDFLSDNSLWPITLQSSASPRITVLDRLKPQGFALLRTDCRPTISPCSGCTALDAEAAHEARPRHREVQFVSQE